MRRSEGAEPLFAVVVVVIAQICAASHRRASEVAFSSGAQFGREVVRCSNQCVDNDPTRPRSAIDGKVYGLHHAGLLRRFPRVHGCSGGGHHGDRAMSLPIEALGSGIAEHTFWLDRVKTGSKVVFWGVLTYLTYA